MPTYEYKCQSKNCCKEWEAIQSIKEESITLCPYCQQNTAKRLISQSTFILQGGGWYAEGYSNK